MDSLLRCCDDDTTFSYIRGFLSAAWEQNHKTARNFSSLPVISVAVPQQIGLAECGIFVILFAKHLLEVP
ncbi:hypothetical protein AMEX_G8355 [Astyanax mexicanus]|uniref:Ubiquitin-like protease family profile domain-containing protein n=1 Tax=Astyanax mexicanus TaxID=7994 RepID=A0A8T2LWJ5_ASTMX|nr:hypothetical protein AMEX_G8355 [Astyanax mexicanus]